MTQNLHQALQQFRRDGIESWLWIDAICIEQSNNFGKAWQIMEMSEVFGRADTVHLWLGPGCIGSDSTMDFICRVGHRAQNCDVSTLWNNATRKQEVSSYIEKRASLQEVDRNPTEKSELGSFIYDLLNEDALQTRSPLKAGIRNILERNYWHRIRVIQEIVLAKDALVVVGIKSVSLEIFDVTFAAIWCCIYFQLRPVRPEWKDFGAGLQVTLYRVKCLDIRRHRQQNPTSKSVRLGEILWELGAAPGYPYYTATDSTDVLFRLLSIVEGEQIGRIRADYSMSVADVSPCRPGF
ncbi:hypothetical protein QQZ08_005896 [Neonectria magnoliae]|uniref:Heterokaryon incompatibility domain-containing protein n=1 Tax=Neonectria magnoliae TaxID=2732573 RepID=A0ABR1I438_9HYPO